jgi:ectoine hydroxylase-related dioxygenase (phytanoyl-CoA dioxygenase family)
MAFLPEHFQARPRQTYYHMVHILNPIAPGGGGTYVVPGSHLKTYAAAEKLGLERLGELKNDPIGVAGLDIKEAIEMQPQEGDLFVFNPMCLHSASVNTSSQPRYVYFASFFDPSAQYLQDHLKAVNYQRSFPDSLRDNLPTAMQTLVAA